jgi:hypothetical protein
MATPADAPLISENLKNLNSVTRAQLTKSFPAAPSAAPLSKNFLSLAAVLKTAR